MSHFTKSLLDVLEETGGEVKNVDLIERVNFIFEKNNLTQRADLYCDEEQGFWLIKVTLGLLFMFLRNERNQRTIATNTLHSGR
jgi:hypothetical protein